MASSDQQNTAKLNSGQQNINMEELATTMTKGIRRWEKVIYPMMIAFIILAAYGFYLIYSITSSMNNISTNMVVMTRAVVTMTNTLNHTMNKIDHQMGAINIHMDKMNRNIEPVKTMHKKIADMANAVEHMDSSIEDMSLSVSNMNQSVYSMVYSTNNMSSSLGELNHNISPPLNAMNSVMPWSMLPGAKSSSRNRSTRPPAYNYNYNNAPYRQPNGASFYRPQQNTVPATNTHQAPNDKNSITSKEP